MQAFVQPTIRVVTLDALHHFLHTTGHQLHFRDASDKTLLNGPCVYVHVDAQGGIYYVGKGASLRRPRQYAGMHKGYLAEGGLADPTSLPEADSELTRWAPIVRFDVVYGLRVMVATLEDVEDVSNDHHEDAHEKSAGWEARIKAFLGTLTGVESLLGGGVWEANLGTLRGSGYTWVREALAAYRLADPDSPIFD